MTALRRLLLGRWCWHGCGGRWGRGAAGGEEALGEGAVELLAGVEVIRLILLAQVAGGEGFGGIGHLHGGDGFVVGFEGGVRFADGGAQQGGVRREDLLVADSDTVPLFPKP